MPIFRSPDAPSHCATLRGPQRSGGTDQVWWPGGADDPTLRVLRIEPKTAELWDGPSNSIVAAFEFAKARLTGGKPNLGENRKITVPM
jgi:hypothetical protein